MKAIDFTHPGGFPLTQDELDHLQKAYTECLNAFAVMGGAGPTLIAGMGTSFSMGITTVYDGWFFYNGEMVRFTASTYGAMAIGDVPLVSISTTTSPLTYNDGSIYNSHWDKTATIIAGPPATTSTTFPLSDLQPFHLVFGQNGRESGWRSMIVNTPPASGGVTGTIFYKKNILTNTLHIRSFLTANNAQNFSASPLALFYLMGTLPVDYRPANNVYFTGHYHIANMIQDDLNVGWIKQFTCGVNIGGQVSVNWIRPDISIIAYAIQFNTMLPLD